MVNYYEALGLDPESSLAELNTNLVHLEQIWHRRELSRPEAATENLALINRAKQVFSSEDSKRSYDLSLNNDQKAPARDADQDRQNAAHEWYLKALQNSLDKQWDVAREAISRALSLSKESDKEYGIINNEAASILIRTHEYRAALSMENRAILSDPDNPNYYLNKANIFFFNGTDMLKALWAGQQFDSFEYEKVLDNEREAFKLTLKKAKQADNQIIIEASLDNLVRSYHYDVPNNEDTALDYAGQLVNYMKSTREDGWEVAFRNMQAQKVLEEISNKGTSYQSEKAKELLGIKQRPITSSKSGSSSKAAFNPKPPASSRRTATGSKQHSSSPGTAGELLKDIKGNRNKYFKISCIIYGLVILICIITVSSGSVGFFGFLTVLATACINFMNTYRNKIGNPRIRIITIAAGAGISFRAATARYVGFGYGPAGAARAWRTFIILFILITLSAVISEKAGVEKA